MILSFWQKRKNDSDEILYTSLEDLETTLDKRKGSKQKFKEWKRKLSECEDSGMTHFDNSTDLFVEKEENEKVKQEETLCCGCSPEFCIIL